MNKIVYTLGAVDIALLIFVLLYDKICIWW